MVSSVCVVVVDEDVEGNKTRARVEPSVVVVVGFEFIIQQELNFDGTSSHLDRIT